MCVCVCVSVCVSVCGDEGVFSLLAVPDLAGVVHSSRGHKHSTPVPAAAPHCRDNTTYDHKKSVLSFEIVNGVICNQ